MASEHAAGLDFRPLRILVLVDHVLADAFIHRLANFGLDPGLAESGKVLPRVSIEQQFIVHELIRHRRIRLLPGKLVLGQRMQESAGSEHPVVKAGDDFFLRVNRHGLTLPENICSREASRHCAETVRSLDRGL